jgi:hypothetical protein
MKSNLPVPDSYRPKPTSAAARTCMTAIAFIAWFALALQFYLMVIDSQAQGAARIRLIVNYFRFFTILTNLLVALGLTVPLVMPNSCSGKFFARSLIASGTAVYIAIVGITYSLLLRHLWNPQGAQKIADTLLHDVVPLLYVAYWLFFVPKGLLRWKDALWWLPYPLAYFCYSLIRGAAIGWYPYPFIDAGKLGYSRVLANAAMLVFAFLTFALLVVAFGRRTGRNAPSG